MLNRPTTTLPMTRPTIDDHSAVLPALQYKDTRAAVDWLCDTFGFERRLVIPGEGDGVRHARLTFGTGMVMVSPGEATGAGVYVTVPDVDAHCVRARAAGAEIVVEPADQPFGGRFYSCRDLEGHTWAFGTLDPWLPVEAGEAR